MKPTTILYLTLFAFSATLFISCDKKRSRRSSNKSHTESATVIDTADNLTDEMVNLMDQLVNIMITIKDKDSAIESEQKIDSLADDLEGLAERFKKLEDPSPEERKRLKEKMDAAEKEMGEKMNKHAGEIGKNAEIIEVMGPIMQKFQARMDKIDPVFKKFGMK